MPGHAVSRDPEPRVAALAERYALPGAAVGQLLALHRLLVEDPLAPTAVRDPLKAIDEHLADSLVGLELEAAARPGPLRILGRAPVFLVFRSRSRCLRRLSRSLKASPGGAPSWGGQWRSARRRTHASSTRVPRPGPRAWARLM